MRIFDSLVGPGNPGILVFAPLSSENLLFHQIPSLYELQNTGIPPHPGGVSVLRGGETERLFALGAPQGGPRQFFSTPEASRDDFRSLSVATLAARALQEASGRQNGASGDRFWIVFGLLFLPFAASLVWPFFASLGGRILAFSFARFSCSRVLLVKGANAPHTVKHNRLLKFLFFRRRPRATKKGPTTNRRRVRKQTARTPKKHRCS